jgi:hypothetical protein
MRWLKDGDANLKLFHAMANGRRIKNFIPAIHQGDELVTDPERKGNFFSRLTGIFLE